MEEGKERSKEVTKGKERTKEVKEGKERAKEVKEGKERMKESPGRCSVFFSQNATINAQ